MFESDLDRIYFLGLLAEACLKFGGICHAFTLMTNHLHLVLEDVRGTLSQLMHHVEGCYAQFFNTSRGGRRRQGPLFQGRFGAELIDTPEYFESACAYVLLNPLRTAVPLAASPEAYRWSSASLSCSNASGREFASALLETVGGVEGVLSLLPKTRRKESRENRQRRLDALASGGWVERERLLGGRTGDEYRRRLRERAGLEPEVAVAPPAERRPLSEVRAAPSELVEARARFEGLEFEGLKERIEEAVAVLVPRSMAELSEYLEDLVTYELFRFSRPSLPELATALGLSFVGLQELVCRIRGELLKCVGWRRMVWRLEWGLRWRLRAGPHRA
jgi:REP element-mobilizing transposase RayT